MESLAIGRKSESGAGSKMAPLEGLFLWAERSSMPLNTLDPWHPLRASFLPHLSPKVTSPSPAQQMLRARMRTVARPYRSERTLLMILCSSSVNQGWSSSSVVSEVALTPESLMSRAKLDVERLKPERSSATEGVGSVVVVVEEPSVMVTLAGEEVLSPKVEEKGPAELVLLAEAASVVEVELSLKKPGSTMVKSLLVESIGCEMVELVQVALVGGKMVEEDAESPEVEKGTKASVRLTCKSGKVTFGAELFAEARGGEDEVEMGSIFKRCHESSSSLRVLQAGLSGRPSMRLIDRLMGPWGATFALLKQAR